MGLVWSCGGDPILAIIRVHILILYTNIFIAKIGLGKKPYIPMSKTKNEFLLNIVIVLMNNLVHFYC